MANNSNERCARCGGIISGYPAISRSMYAEICSECGTEEAILSMLNIKDDLSKWYMNKEEK